MTITLPLAPQEEARIIAVARAKGISTDELLREVLEAILATSVGSGGGSAASVTGAALIDAMQASPFKDTVLEAARVPLPTRDVPA
jgi:hypothetical protein